MSEQERTLFDELHTKHFDTLVHWCLSHVGYKSELRNDAEDWAQEAFKRAIKDKDKFLGSENQLAWLITACKHISGNAFQRKAVRDREKDNLINGPSKPSTDDLQASFNAWTIKVAATDVIDQVTELLTCEEHKVYKKYFVEDLSEKEVSESIGKPVSAIKATIRRIRKKAGKIDEHEGS